MMMRLVSVLKGVIGVGIGLSPSGVGKRCLGYCPLRHCQQHLPRPLFFVMMMMMMMMIIIIHVIVTLLDLITCRG
jgi:hypothetical protein